MTELQKAREYLQDAMTTLNGIDDAQASPEVKLVLSRLTMAVAVALEAQERLAQQVLARPAQ